MLRRPDRRHNMVSMFKQNGIENYEFFEAVDGSKLEATGEIRELFLDNDFSYRKGVVGCALSHYKIWQNLIADTENDFYLVFEDDITDFDNNYIEKMKQIVDKIKFRMPDVVFLGYTMFDENLRKYGNIYNKSDKTIIIGALNKDICIGGTFNYIVSKKGAVKLLDYANKYHIKHGIDYFMKIVPGLDVCETHPHISFSRWVQTADSTVDSDIQKSHDSFHLDDTHSDGTHFDGTHFDGNVELVGDYEFHSGLDSFGSDIKYVGNKTVDELKALCEDNPKCVGFNTLGYLKYHIENNLNSCEYYKSANEGLFVHKARYEVQKKNLIYENSFEYYDGLDAHGNDIEFVGKKTVVKLMKLCENNPLCIGFNSLGFLKHHIGEIATSPYIKNGQGLYIHKERFKIQTKKIRVKLLCNWKSSRDVCEEYNTMTKGNYTWNDIQFVFNDSNIDYYVILNKPCDNSYFDPARTIIFHLEPWCGNDNQNWGVKTWGEWAEPSEEKFLCVRSQKKYLTPAFWQLAISYTDFKTKKITKTKNCISSVCSSKYFDPGHIKRIDFIKYAERINDLGVIIDIYGQANYHKFINYCGPCPNGTKDDCMFPYKYYFMSENNIEKNYITEKIWEPILTETLCFYWGCPNIADWVDPRAYIVLDLDDFDKSFQIIKSAIKNDLWSERIDIIRQEKTKVLEYFNIIPTIERIIIEDQNLKSKQ